MVCNEMELWAEKYWMDFKVVMEVIIEICIMSFDSDGQ